MRATSDLLEPGPVVKLMTVVSVKPIVLRVAEFFSFDGFTFVFLCGVIDIEDGGASMWFQEAHDFLNHRFGIFQVRKIDEDSAAQDYIEHAGWELLAACASATSKTPFGMTRLQI